jgi:predicted nucleic acid-binding protein
MLIDSNIIIYASQPAHADLRRFIAEHTPAVSAISYVEVLGYHKLMDNERQDLETFFAAAPIPPLSDAVLEQAVKLRQIKKMTLGDSLVAATALIHKLTLVTRNTDDFDWIDGLSLLNPFETS